MIESRRYPFWGSAFHPEKVLFDWNNFLTELPHSKEARDVAQFFGRFFVDQARKNNHKFASRDILEKHLIYNFNPTYTGQKSVDYMMEQVYLFK